MNEINYKFLKDEEIIQIVIKGDNNALEYLINKYKKLVKIVTRAYFMAGADKEDVIQEGMIGLYKAIRNYDQMNFASFYTFAKLCIERQVITAIKSANRKKHQPLNTYLSLNNFANNDNDNFTFIDKIEESTVFNPEEILISNESIKNIQNSIENTLSEFEKKVLYLYLKGCSYLYISKTLSKDEKSVDNAIQRIRKKISKIIQY